MVDKGFLLIRLAFQGDRRVGLKGIGNLFWSGAFFDCSKDIPYKKLVKLKQNPHYWGFFLHSQLNGNGSVKQVDLVLVELMKGHSKNGTFGNRCDLLAEDGTLFESAGDFVEFQMDGYGMCAFVTGRERNGLNYRTVFAGTFVGENDTGPCFSNQTWNPGLTQLDPNDATFFKLFHNHNSFSKNDI